MSQLALFTVFDNFDGVIFGQVLYCFHRQREFSQWCLKLPDSIRSQGEGLSSVPAFPFHVTIMCSYLSILSQGLGMGGTSQGCALVFDIGVFTLAFLQRKSLGWRGEGNVSKAIVLLRFRGSVKDSKPPKVAEALQHSRDPHSEFWSQEPFFPASESLHTVTHI